MEIRPLYETHIAQDAMEMDAFVKLLKVEGVAKYLEIGARYGGSFWRVSRSLPIGSRVVAVDLGDGMGSKPDALKSLEDCVKELNRLGYRAHLLIGDSKSPEIVEQARKLGPYHCVFIDGDHRLECVTKDWENYGPMAKMVAFHDITQKPGSSKPIHVPILWEKIKADYSHEEIKLHPTPHNGIGVLWRDQPTTT